MIKGKASESVSVNHKKKMERKGIKRKSKRETLQRKRKKKPRRKRKEGSKR